MSYTLNCFSELANKYPTWPDLQTYLTSPEGGKLRVISSAESPLTIIRYTKGVSDLTKEHVRAFRSVVWNTETNRPVSVAPPKAEEGEPDVDTSLYISDFVDGTMIQAFMQRPDAHVQAAAQAQVQEQQQAQIATRTSLGANGSFYSTRSFAELFNDAMAPLGGTSTFLASVLTPGTFASFVLQHPEHRTVAPVPQPRFYVTCYGYVAADGSVQMNTNPSTWPARLASYAPHVYEESVAFGSKKEAQQLLKHLSLGYANQGLVFQGINSVKRWRLRNPAYLVVRTLRGSESNQTERFLRLRAQRQTKEYLKYFSDESAAMWSYEQTLRAVTHKLYDAYIAVNKLKTHTFKDFHVSLRPHMYALHGQYLASVAKGAAKSVLKEDVMSYVNSLAVPDQVNLLRWASSSLTPVAHPDAPAVAHPVAHPVA